MSTRLPSPQPAQEHFFDFLVKSGRAFLLPVLKGQYQRRFADPPAGPNDYRDRLILESKDFRRAVDYLVRPDVDRDRLGVFGFSRGATRLPILAVGEQRLKAAVLNSVGLSYANPPPLPEADMFNFLPRFRVPTLMVAPDPIFSSLSKHRSVRCSSCWARRKRTSAWSSGMEATATPGPTLWGR